MNVPHGRPRTVQVAPGQRLLMGMYVFPEVRDQLHDLRAAMDEGSIGRTVERLVAAELERRQITD